MGDEAEEQEKGRVLDKRKERIEACCETLDSQTAEMKTMMEQGKFEKIQETTQAIKENEIELKTLNKNITELQFVLDAQVATQSVEARIPQVAITSGDGAPGIFFTGTGSASPPPASPAQTFDAGAGATQDFGHTGGAFGASPMR